MRVVGPNQTVTCLRFPDSRHECRPFLGVQAAAEIVDGDVEIDLGSNNYIRLIGVFADDLASSVFSIV